MDSEGTYNNSYGNRPSVSQGGRGPILASHKERTVVRGGGLSRTKIQNVPKGIGDVYILKKSSTRTSGPSSPSVMNGRRVFG